MISIGLADLSFQQKRGRTRLVHCQVTPPLVVQRALYLDDALPEMAFVYLSNPTPGFFQGDRLTVQAEVRPGAKAHLTTQSAAKAHAMPGGSASQHIELNVAEGGCLEYLPDPVIPFRGSRLSQSATITVAPGGVLLYGDILTPGRIAMGETFGYAQFQCKLAVKDDRGRLLCHEAYSVEPSKTSPSVRGVLGTDRAPVLGTLVVAGGDVDKLKDGLGQCMTVHANAVERAKAGVSVFPGGGGVVVKVLAQDTGMAAALMRSAWAEARRQLLGAGLPRLRKY